MFFWDPKKSIHSPTSPAGVIRVLEEGPLFIPYVRHMFPSLSGVQLQDPETHSHRSNSDQG